jgi:hypothetical protein
LRRGGRRGGIALGALAALVASAGLSGCDSPCCTVESAPIPLLRAPRGDGNDGAMPTGALLASARDPNGGTPFVMVVDTGSPVTLLSGAAAGAALAPSRRSFDLLDATAPGPVPVRARFRNIGVFTLPLGPAGDAATMPGGVLGGDLLSAFSIELRFAGACPGAAPGAAGTCSSVTFWSHQGASTGFLGDAGYAVLRFNLFGGGETTARTEPDAVGLRGPVDLPATRVVLRACGAPRAFVPADEGPLDQCCARGEQITRASGVDLSLVLATGAGPLVLSRKAWTRLSLRLPAPPVEVSGSLHLANWPAAIAASWSTIPRFALVDGGEPPSTGDEGPCVDLGRSRRIEWVAARQQAAMVAGANEAACVQPCDTDPREPSLSLNSAAYIELGGAIPVAVIDDAEPYLQALRFDIRPEGPEVDGLVGAAALGPARLELDYRSDPRRAIFSCEPNVPRATCYTAARCPRLPDHEQSHLCFGLPSHRLPNLCAASGC